MVTGWKGLSDGHVQQDVGITAGCSHKGPIGRPWPVGGTDGSTRFHTNHVAADREFE